MAEAQTSAAVQTSAAAAVVGKGAGEEEEAAAGVEIRVGAEAKLGSDQGQLQVRQNHLCEIPHRVGNFCFGAGEHGDRPRGRFGMETSAGTAECRPRVQGGAILGV